MPAKKLRYATEALFHGFPATLIAQVLCCTVQTAYHFKSGIRRPGAAALKLWTLYHCGRILDDAWNGWQARDGVLFDPEGHRTTQGMLRAYAFVWDLARELAKGDPIAMEALDRYAVTSLTSTRLTRQRKVSAREQQRRDERDHVYDQLAAQEQERREREADARSAPTAPPARIA